MCVYNIQYHCPGPRIATGISHPILFLVTDSVLSSVCAREIACMFARIKLQRMPIPKKRNPLSPDPFSVRTPFPGGQGVAQDRGELRRALGGSGPALPPAAQGMPALSLAIHIKTP